MCSLLESERPADLPPGMMEKILISSSGEPLVQAGSEDIPAKESMVTDAVMMAELEGITPASGYDGGKNLMNPQPMEVEESPVAGKDIILIPDDVISISDEDVISIPDAEELRRMMEDDYVPSGGVKPMSKEGMIGNTSLEESGLSEHMDVDVVLYQPCPSTLVHPSSLAPQVPRCTGSSIQPGSKRCRDDLSSSPEQSKELTLHQRLGPPVDISASWPLQGGSLISWMTEQPPHMSCSSAHPSPPLLLLSPPQSHIPTCPHSPHPYLPSCHCSPSSHGYHHHSPLPSSRRPRYCSPLPHYCSPSSCYHSPSPRYCSPLPRRHHYHPPPPRGAHHCSPLPCGPCCSLPSPHRPSHRSPLPHEPLCHPPSPCGPHCPLFPGHGLSCHAPSHGQHSPPHSYSPSPPHPSPSQSVPVLSNEPSGIQLASFGRG